MTIQVPRTTMQWDPKQKGNRQKLNRWRRHRSDTSVRYERTEKTGQDKRVIMMREVRARVEELVKNKTNGRTNMMAKVSRFVRRAKKLAYGDISTTSRCFRRHSGSSALAEKSLLSLLHTRVAAESSPPVSSAPEAVLQPQTAERDCDAPEPWSFLTGSDHQPSSVLSLNYYEDLCSSSSVKSEEGLAKDFKECVELQELLDQCEVDMEELPDVTHSEISDLSPVDIALFNELIQNWSMLADLEPKDDSTSRQDGWRPHFTTPGIFTCAGFTETRLSASGASLPCLPLPAKAGGLFWGPRRPIPDLCCSTWSSLACLVSAGAAPSSGCAVSLPVHQQFAPTLHPDSSVHPAADEGVHEVQRLGLPLETECADMRQRVPSRRSKRSRTERRKALLGKCARTIITNYPELTLEKLRRLKQLQKSGVRTALAALPQDTDKPSPGPRCFRGSSPVTSTPTPVDRDCQGTPLADSGASDADSSSAEQAVDTNQKKGTFVDGTGPKRPGSPASESVTNAQSPLLSSRVPADSPCPAQSAWDTDTDHQYCRSNLSRCHDDSWEDPILALRLRLRSTDSAFSDSALGSESEEELGFGRRGSWGYGVVAQHNDSEAPARTVCAEEQWAEGVKDPDSDSVYGSDDEFFALDNENYTSGDDDDHHDGYDDDANCHQTKLLGDNRYILDHEVTMWDGSGCVAKKPAYHKMGFLSDSEDEGDEGPLEQTTAEPSRDWVFDLEWSQDDHGSILVL